MSAGILGAPSATVFVNPALGEVFVVDVIGPLVIALTLLAAILCGSNRTVERVFGLLCWAMNRPEPA